VSGDRIIAAQDWIWDSVYAIEDEDERLGILDLLFDLLDDPVPPEARPIVLDYHGTVAPGYSIDTPSGRGFVPYIISRLASGREVVRFFEPIWRAPQEE
jgi:hypothetical protein